MDPRAWQPNPRTPVRRSHWPVHARFGTATEAMLNVRVGKESPRWSIARLGRKRSTMGRRGRRRCRAAPVAIPRTVETTTKTRSRRPRSASGAASGATTADGTIRSSATSPTAVAPPVPEGDDSQCHGERPLSSPSSEEAQLSAAQIAVHSIAGEGGCGNVQPVAHRLIHLR